MRSPQTADCVLVRNFHLLCSSELFILLFFLLITSSVCFFFLLRYQWMRHESRHMWCRNLSEPGWILQVHLPTWLLSSRGNLWRYSRPKSVLSASWPMNISSNVTNENTQQLPVYWGHCREHLLCTRIDVCSVCMLTLMRWWTMSLPPTPLQLPFCYKSPLSCLLTCGSGPKPEHLVIVYTVGAEERDIRQTSTHSCCVLCSWEPGGKAPKSQHQ